MTYRNFSYKQDIDYHSLSESKNEKGRKGIKEGGKNLKQIVMTAIKIEVVRRNPEILFRYPKFIS